MVTITYVDQNGAATELQVAEGTSLMEAAVRGGVTAIEGECGGALACATCHVYIPHEWRGMTGEPSEDESEMLQFGVDVDDRSRLSCQIAVTAAMQGIKVLMPRSQR